MSNTATIPTKEMLREYRCECGKLLFKAALLAGAVEIKCKRCGKLRLIVSPQD